MYHIPKLRKIGGHRINTGHFSEYHSSLKFWIKTLFNINIYAGDIRCRMSNSSMLKKFQLCVYMCVCVCTHVHMQNSLKEWKSLTFTSKALSLNYEPKHTGAE